MEEYVYSVQRKGLGPSNTRSYMNYISTPQLGFADIRLEAAKTAKACLVGLLALAFGPKN